MNRPRPTGADTIRPLINPHAHHIVLAHGGGGQLTDQLVRDLVQPALSNEYLDGLDDAAIVPAAGDRVAFTTDSYVVRPLEFPGGDIGRLAVSGTVNDLAVCGARASYISLGLILEEGLEIELLRRVLASAAATAKEARVPIVTGDTKVVARGQADCLYINTSGVGVVPPESRLGIDRIRAGDLVLVNGPVADHGLAVMLSREKGAAIESRLRSDVAPLNGLIAALLDSVPDVVFLRDATRGGLAGVVSDIAEKSGLHLTLDETKIPVRPETRYAADMLGLEPLDVANEGKVVIVIRPESVDESLRILRAHPLGREAAVIGEFGAREDGLCELITDVGGRRIIQKPYGEELPRIC